MKKVKLGDLVTVMNEREDNPSQSKYDRFVGLEHYDSGSVSITRWGSTEMLVSAMKVFHRGDILMMRVERQIVVCNEDICDERN